jgi:outer membrane protein OmpA-like peptidoglycan-associated protein
MKNRMVFTRWRSHPDPRIPEASRIEKVQVWSSEAWRAWEAASSSEFFNWFVFRPHRMLAAATPPFLEDWIYFQDHAWELDGRARAALSQKMPLFRANPSMRIVIGGVASHPGTVAYGMRLGLRRVLSIRAYLLAHDIDPCRVGIAIRGTGWSLTESSDESVDVDTPRSECRLQVTDAHWVLARN